MAPPPAPAAEDDGSAPHGDGSGDQQAFAPPEEDEDEDARSSTPASLTTLGSAAHALVETTRRHGGSEVILQGNAPVGIIRDGQRGMWFGDETTEGSRRVPQGIYEMCPWLGPNSPFYETSHEVYPRYGAYLREGTGADQSALREQHSEALAATASRVTAVMATRPNNSWLHAKDGQNERTGKFSKPESAEVMQAAEDEAKSRGVTVSQMVEKSDWGCGDKNPWRAIAEKIPQRSARSILGHVKRNGHSGAKQKGVKWTLGESQALKEAFDKNPSNWKQIAQGFDRTPGACRDRYRTLFGEVPAKGTPHSEAKEFKIGNWGADEDNRLRNCKSKNGRPVCKEVDPETISFSDVARAVKTRSRLQCRRRWAELRGPAAPPSKKLDSASEKLSLCEALKASGATDESDVTWTSLGWDVPGAATACALSTWKRLKKAHGGGDDADFQEALDAVTSELQAEVDGGAD